MIQRRPSAPVRQPTRKAFSAPIESLEKRQLFAAQLLLPTTVEINEDAGTITVLMALSEAAPVGGASVSYTTVEGTAEAGGDYTTTIGVVQFAEGETGGQVVIPIIYDDSTEPLESFSLSFFSPQNVTFTGEGNPSVTVQIIDVPGEDDNGGDDGGDNGGGDGTGVDVSVIDTAVEVRNGDAAIAGQSRGRVEATVVNDGDVTIDGPYTVQFYASTDGEIDGGDTLLGSKTVNTDLRAGRDRDVKLDFTFPDVGDSDYVILSQLVLSEAQAADNAGQTVDAAPEAVTIAAPFVDLSATELEVKFKGASAIGDQTKGSAKVTIASEGNITYKGPVTVEFYASTDDVLDGGDTQFASVTKTVGIKSGDDKTVTANFTFPDVTDGLYTILARVVPVDVEANAENNVVGDAEPILIAAPFVDLSAESMDLTYKGAPGAVIGDLTTGTATVEIANLGNVTYRGPITVTFYASADDVLDESDTAFGQAIKNVSLKSDRTTTIKATGPFPNVPDGDYLIVADVEQVEGETNVDDNAVAYDQPITIAAPFVDLVGLTLTAPETMTLGGRSARATLTVTNDGNTTASGDLPVSYYLSADDVLDESDILVTEPINRGSIKAGQTKSLRATVPSLDEESIAPGEYFLVAVINPAEDIVESNTDNNVVFSDTTITIEA